MFLKGHFILSNCSRAADLCLPFFSPSVCRFREGLFAGLEKRGAARIPAGGGAGRLSCAPLTPSGCSCQHPCPGHLHLLLRGSRGGRCGLLGKSPESRPAFEARAPCGLVLRSFPESVCQHRRRRCAGSRGAPVPQPGKENADSERIWSQARCSPRAGGGRWGGRAGGAGRWRPGLWGARCRLPSWPGGAPPG